MKLTEVNEAEKESYNSFVAGQLTGSFLQAWEWGSWQRALGRAVFRFKILDDSGGQIGLIQLIKMPLPFGKYYLYAPYGPVVDGKFEIQSASWRTKFETIFKELKFKFPQAVFIRVEPKDVSLIFNLKSLIKSQNIQPGKTLIIDLSKSEAELLAAMHPKTRYNIKVAQKRGCQIKDEFDISIGHGLFFEEALKLITETSKRQKFNTFPLSYYKKMTDQFVLNNKKFSGQSAEALAKEDALNSQSGLKLHIYKAVFQNRLLATAFMLDFGQTRTFLFGGSSEADKNIMAPYLMHWQAILDAKQQGPVRAKEDKWIRSR